jgi:hypothetical protein
MRSSVRVHPYVSSGVFEKRLGSSSLEREDNTFSLRAILSHCFTAEREYHAAPNTRRVTLARFLCSSTLGLK